MRKAAIALAAGAFVTGALLTAPAASATTAALGCQYNYGTPNPSGGTNGFAAKCDTDGPAYEFRAWVQCENGRRDGGWVRTNTGLWSAANCGPWYISRISYGLDKRPVS
ncbi:hypothetical protein [Spongiactinospora sp. TRM90649]|uniref:hypothetical protein n=1 Tax=Spongiactinospora sp. TRM90649 TaxID=3031114 RepID=UPI0023F68D17|nr:hypothetical protein [Spongiactinospora sp. TRM90649]MDF5755896.1 hypothetical protein [Spongiactinospora sp. TRM90649]